MADRYDLRSQDLEASAYAALPGTQAEFVAHNMTPLKSNLVGREMLGMSTLYLVLTNPSLQTNLTYRVPPEPVDIRADQ
jgi:hypothetical protein